MASISFTICQEGGGLNAEKHFTLETGTDKAVRIGRAPGNDFVLEHRGISQFHTEIRTLSNGASEGGARLCVRDLSMNGTGVKKGGRDSNGPAVSLSKGQDEPLLDGACLLLPMRLSKKWVESAEESQKVGDRCWLSIKYGGANGGDSNRSGSHEAAKNRGDSSEVEDSEANRKLFVEMLLTTRSITAGTTYEDAEELLGTRSEWNAVSDLTRKETFNIFVSHLGSHQSKKKDKKDKKDKKGKKDDAGGKRRKEARDASASGERTRRKSTGGRRDRSRNRNRSRSRRRGGGGGRRSPSMGSN